MNTKPLRSVTPAIDVYIKLAQYPILSDQIRLHMREELFRRGIVSREDFEREVKELAIESQRREGLGEPFTHEEETIWLKRERRIRDFHTDAYFADNLGSTLLAQIIEEVLSNQPAQTDSIDLTFNPEIAPWELLFRQGEIYEAMPPPEQEKIKHHLEELKVVLIKRMLSDQLPFIGVAKDVFDMADLRWIYRRRIGTGKIGGKAAGMLLAWKILQQKNPEVGPDISDSVTIPDSYFLCSEIIYEYSLLNKLDHHLNQKYLPLPEIQAEYPDIVKAFMAGQFPEVIIEQLQQILAQIGKDPLIVRSSSLLEDNFAHPFAEKYASYICPNQSTEEENLADLLNAVRRIYASTLNPAAIAYRQKHGLIDYDERMAVLLQRLQGKRVGRYFLPVVTGIGLSQNPHYWHPKIRQEDGFLELILGVGSRNEKQYKRQVALSHPRSWPQKELEARRTHCQRFVTVVDMEENCLQTISLPKILQTGLQELRYLVSLANDNKLQEISDPASLTPSDSPLLTFDTLVKDRMMIKLMRTSLMRLEKAYGSPVRIEFVLEILPDGSPSQYRLSLLQCHPSEEQTLDE